MLTFLLSGNASITEHGMKLHAFADASTKACGAVISLYYSDLTTFVLLPKGVALLKQITLQKHELMVAVIRSC